MSFMDELFNELFWICFKLSIVIHISVYVHVMMWHDVMMAISQYTFLNSTVGSDVQNITLESRDEIIKILYKTWHIL